MSRFLRIPIATSVFVLTICVGSAGATEINTGYFGNVAIEGYDTVAYFTDHKAVKGSDEYSYDWLGATWHFANASHRDMFKQSPIAYAPQYGGYCAEGMAFDEQTVNIEPQAFQIIDGKLYLSGGASFEDLETNRHKADETWPKVREQIISGVE